jgi:transposase
MKAYSEDLRQKVFAALERGISSARANRLFGVSLPSVKRNARMAREGASLAPKKRSGQLPKIDEKGSSSWKST